MHVRCALLLFCSTPTAVAAGGTGGGSAGSEGDTAESALAKALQQLAALAGETMSSRINVGSVGLFQPRVDVGLVLIWI